MHPHKHVSWIKTPQIDVKGKQRCQKKKDIAKVTVVIWKLVRKVDDSETGLLQRVASFYDENNMAVIKMAIHELYVGQVASKSKGSRNKRKQNELPDTNDRFESIFLSSSRLCHLMTSLPKTQDMSGARHTHMPTGWEKKQTKTCWIKRNKLAWRENLLPIDQQVSS